MDLSDSDPFAEELASALAVLPSLGSRVRVDDDPGIVVAMRVPSTARVEYEVDHGNGVPYLYVVDLWVPDAGPAIELV